MGLRIDGNLEVYSDNTSYGSLKDIKSKAPTAHASSSTTYGVGTTANYGHNKVINDLTHNAFANGESLSAYQGYLLDQNKQGKITKVTNSYGACWKFDNGLMICNMRYPITTAINTAWGSGYISGDKALPSFPAAFNALPAVTITADGVDGAIIFNGGTAVSNSKPQSIYLARFASISSKTFYINITAIGTWK